MKIDSSEITGHLVLVMAPSGSGKGSILAHVKETFPEIIFSVSCTTRDPREGEVDGKNYHFISRERFMERVDNGEFLEWAEYGGNLYGTLYSEITEPLKERKLIINELELQGVESIKKLVPQEHRTVIYIDGGDWETLKKRILKRAPMSEEKLALRQKRYEEEVKAREHADIIVKNPEGGLSTAQKEFNGHIQTILTKIGS